MTTPGFSDSDTEHSSQYSQDDALPEPLTLRGNDEIQSSSDIVELTEHLALAVQELCKWDESTTEVVHNYIGISALTYAAHFVGLRYTPWAYTSTRCDYIVPRTGYSILQAGICGFVCLGLSS